DADVLDGVVQIDLEIALGVHGEIHQAVARPGVQHVVEERDPRVDLGGAGAVHVQLEDDLRLLGVALHPRLARGGSRSAHGVASMRAMRTDAAAPWASSRSTRESSATWRPASRRPAAEYSMTLRRLTKSSVPS